MDGNLLVVRTPESRLLRLDTLVNLRWLAIVGQLLAVLVVNYGFGFALPMPATLGIISVSAALNLTLRVRYPLNHRMNPGSAAGLLAFDIVQLASLLFLTGGLENPFAILFLAPVMISATVLPPKLTLGLGALAMLATTVLTFLHLPLPWAEYAPVSIPALYVAGVWCAILLGLTFIGVFAWRVAEESRQLGEALAATELVLAREKHLTQLDGLAAAAAHELGTPLATIALVVKEIDRDMRADNPLKDDVALLQEQTDRCRQILAKITTLGTEPTGPMRLVGLRQLVEEVSAPHRPFHAKIAVVANGEGNEPLSVRSPGLIYGLENLIDNAVDFATSTVTVTALWTVETVSVLIQDDGPGFAPDVLRRLGEPYVTTRRLSDRNRNGVGGGMGLGLFIAKTLLERSGAVFSAQNQSGAHKGAEVRLMWKRADFEAAASA
jgi:two-component system, sensor histidine kinase RegB